MIRDMIKSVLRGVSDFTKYPDVVDDNGNHTQWYPDPKVGVLAASRSMSSISIPSSGSCMSSWASPDTVSSAFNASPAAFLDQSTPIPGSGEPFSHRKSFQPLENRCAEKI